jgi:hypothetical protein
MRTDDEKVKMRSWKSSPLASRVILRRSRVIRKNKIIASIHLMPKMIMIYLRHLLRHTYCKQHTSPHFSFVSSVFTLHTYNSFLEALLAPRTHCFPASLSHHPPLATRQSSHSLLGVPCSFPLYHNLSTTTHSSFHN